MKDSYHSVQAVQAIAPAVKTDAENGASIDLAGYGSALIVVTTGAVAGDGDFSFKLQESDASGSGFTDVAADDVLGSAPATMDATSAYRVGYIGSKRYIRVATVDNGGTSVAIGAVAILGSPAVAPVA